MFFYHCLCNNNVIDVAQIVAVEVSVNPYDKKEITDHSPTSVTFSYSVSWNKTTDTFEDRMGRIYKVSIVLFFVLTANNNPTHTLSLYLV